MTLDLPTLCAATGTAKLAEKEQFIKGLQQPIQKALQHTAMLYGSIQGIAGQHALPQIQSLQLPA